VKQARSTPTLHNVMQRRVNSPLAGVHTPGGHLDTANLTNHQGLWTCPYEHTCMAEASTSVISMKRLTCHICYTKQVQSLRRRQAAWLPWLTTITSRSCQVRIRSSTTSCTAYNAGETSCRAAESISAQARPCLLRLLARLRSTDCNVHQNSEFTAVQVRTSASLPEVTGSGS